MIGPFGCDCVHAAIDVTPEYLQSGIKFSWPIYKAGLKIMVAKGVEVQSDFWAFTKAYTGEVWLAMGCTCLFIAIFVWAVELVTYGRGDEQTMGEVLSLGVKQAGRQ